MLTYYNHHGMLPAERSSMKVYFVYVYNRGFNLFGADRRLANAKSSMLQETKRDAACMYAHTSFDAYSNRHVLGQLLCARGITLCFAVLAVQRHTYSYILLRYCCLLLHTYCSRMFVAVQKAMENED